MKETFEKLLTDDSENWIIYSDIWINYWNGDKTIELIVDDTSNGFILINDNHIYFAFVSSKKRRNGILKKMMIVTKQKYKSLTLSSLDNTTDKIWNYFDFKIYKKRTNCNECSLMIYE